jgi:hypothetical protein
MNFGADLLPILIVIAVVLILWVLLRRRKPFAAPQVRVVNDLLSDTRINLRLVEVMIKGEQIKHFCMNGWNMNKGQVGFLRKSLQEALAETYELTEDYNRQVQESREKGGGYIGTVDTELMVRRLHQVKSGLEDWLMATTGTIEPGGKGGLFDILLGR